MLPASSKPLLSLNDIISTYSNFAWCWENYLRKDFKNILLKYRVVMSTYILSICLSICTSQVWWSFTLKLNFELVVVKDRDFMTWGMPAVSIIESAALYLPLEAMIDNLLFWCYFICYWICNTAVLPIDSSVGFK